MKKQFTAQSIRENGLDASIAIKLSTLGALMVEGFLKGLGKGVLYWPGYF